MKLPIMELFQNGDKFSEEELAGMLGYESIVPPVRAELDRLLGRCELVKNRNGLLGIPETFGLVKGKLEVNRKGFGFVRHEPADVFIGESDLGGALNGQTVVARITDGDSRRPAGRIIRVSDEPFFLTGTYERVKNLPVVICSDRSVGMIHVPRKQSEGAEYGQKVVCQLVHRARRGMLPEGRITEILGFRNEPGVDVLTVARSYGLVQEFPEDVEAQAQSYTEPSSEEIAHRENLFDKCIFTIDGEDAKDLDDAVSLEKLDNGSWLLGVHIADVSHYVTENSALDREAYKRGTSVYLMDRVIPMLPRALSNGICSLNEGVPRLTLSCFMEIDSAGTIRSGRLAETVIRTRHRMTYTNVNRMLAGEELPEYADIAETAKEMNRLAKLLRRKRFSQGAIDFDIPEAKITLGEDGWPTEIGLRERGDAEKLIEEFMIAANNTVAEQFYFGELPFLYRTHERPDSQKMREFSVFLKNLGYVLKGTAAPHGTALQKVLDESADQKEGAIIKRLMLRSMKKARYTAVNCGHFGLASQAYSHFTSPIRRYPDLQIHRIVKDQLNGRLTAGKIEKYEGMLAGVAQQCCDRELNAIEAERMVDDIKKAEYMHGHIGEEFSGVISGVTPRALFLELDNTVEGVLPLENVEDDFYHYIEEQYCVVGERTRKRITIGDKMTARLESADPETGRIEFSRPAYRKKKHYDGKKSFKSGRRVVK